MSESNGMSGGEMILFENAAAETIHFGGPEPIPQSFAHGPQNDGNEPCENQTILRSPLPPQGGDFNQAPADWVDPSPGDQHLPREGGGSHPPRDSRNMVAAGNISDGEENSDEGRMELDGDNSSSNSENEGVPRLLMDRP